MIDVSEYQGHINWHDVYNDGIRVAAIKAGEGFYEVDPLYFYNYIAARNNGILACPYFFAHPSLDPKPQARHLLRIIGENALHRGRGRIGLDIEVEENCSAHELQKWCVEWCGIIDPLIRAKVIIYTYSAFAPKLGKALVDHPLWIANYNGKPSLPPNAIGEWPHGMVVAHQYTSHGTKAGINGNVDVSVRYAALRRFKNGRVVW